MTDRPHLHTLARRVGILPEYHDISGVLHRTSDATHAALLAAMGLNGQTEEAALRELEHLDIGLADRMLPAVRVVRRSSPDARLLRVRLPRDLSGEREWHLEVQTESGESLRASGRVTPTNGEASIEMPALPLPGYHELRLQLAASGVERSGTCRYIVVPDRCSTVQDVLGAQRVFGVIANLYSVRSEGNWGIGDFSDLAELCRWTGRKGGHFFGVNPLHALRNLGHDVSPYSPTSRLFRNVIYLDPTAVPEFATSAHARKFIESSEFQGAIADLRTSERVDYAAVRKLKLRVMQLLFSEFRDPINYTTARSAEFAAYCARGGETLQRFCVFSALEEHFADHFRTPRDWRRWPAEYRCPDSPAVAEFARTHPQDVEFHQFMQFELARQLGEAAAAARQSGMRVGLYQDLAIGSAPSGSDTWANPGLFVVGARVGAPPDEYSRAGQDWGLPPIHPLRLAEQRFAYWTQLLRANFDHSGALRIDHAMGLLRQFWIPPGATPREGAYVRYPAEELFGILALESLRHRAIVIGEDLGTVPAGFKQLLEDWGILSCEVMYFQRDAARSFFPASAYSSRALVTSTTHDHVPLPGFFSAADLQLRRKVDDGFTQDDHAAAESDRRDDRRALIRCLAAPGLLSSAAAEADHGKTPAAAGADVAELTEAVYRFLADTPAPLLGLMLDDLLGEEEPVNLPGVGQEQHPSWSRRMTAGIEELDQHRLAAAALAGAAERAEPERCHRS